jgi:hypothetical protein
MATTKRKAESQENERLNKRLSLLNLGESCNHTLTAADTSVGMHAM